MHAQDVARLGIALDAVCPVWLNARMAKTNSLTDRQAECLNKIREHLAQHGHAPSIAELGSALKLKSSNSVYDLLLVLERKGAIERTQGVARGIRLTGACPTCGREREAT